MEIQMRTSIRINNGINLNSKDIILTGQEQGRFAKDNINKKPKVDISELWKKSIAAIPHKCTVLGVEEEAAAAFMIATIEGAIPTVSGSVEAFKPDNFGDNFDKNFGEYLYHGISGVHTGAKRSHSAYAEAALKRRKKTI